MNEELKTGWKFIVNAGGMISKLPYEEALNSDQAEIKSTLGREMIQNSIDACVNINQPVKMSFRWINFENDSFLSSYVNELIPRLKKMDKVFDPNKVDVNNPSFLVIEDFNATGLTGKFNPTPDEIDKDFPNNYFGYFHKLGYSGKSQLESTTGGRRGIGRSVGAIVSSLNSMLVISKRNDDDITFLKGLCLGEKFVYDDKVYDGYGYFCKYSENSTTYDPITEDSYINTLSEKLQISRNNEYGTSTIIPFPDNDLVDYNQVTLQILKNYYVVIGDGKLEIEISYKEGTIEEKYSFNKENILEKLSEHNLKEEYDFLKNFILPCFGKLNTFDFELKSEAHADGKIDKKDFTEEEIKDLRDKFNRKELINLKANIVLKPKYKNNKPTISSFNEATYINFFFQKTDSDTNSKAYYQRGLMPLMGEGKDFSANSYGFMYAYDQPAVSFIAASEGTNHLTINTSEAELRKNYRPPFNRQAKFIKKGLYQIMDLILLVDNEEDTNFEKDYFSTVDLEGENDEILNISDEDEEVKDEDEKEEIPVFTPIGQIPKGDGKPFKVTRLTSERGYKIKINKSFKNVNSMFPFKISFKCAYSESGKKKSFNNHEDLDFDLKTDSQIKIDCKDVDILERNTQSVNFEIKNIESEIKITNFYEKFEVDLEIEQI